MFFSLQMLSNNFTEYEYSCTNTNRYRYHNKSNAGNT